MEKAKEEVESSRVESFGREREKSNRAREFLEPTPLSPLLPRTQYIPNSFYYLSPPNFILTPSNTTKLSSSYILLIFPKDLIHFPLHRSSCSIAVNSNTEPPPHARSNGRDTIVTDLRPRTHPPLHSWSQYALKTIRLRVMLTI